MILVKAEIWPRGSELKAREIARVLIVNDGTGNREHGNYEVHFLDPDQHPHVRPSSPTARIDAYPREANQAHVLGLIAEAITVALPKIAPKPFWEGAA